MEDQSIEVENAPRTSDASAPRANVVRRGFGLKGEIRETLINDYHSAIVEKVKSQGHALTVGRLTFRLAEEFGFCYGVDFALNLAYETRRQFPDRRIFLTNEIIHNPRVNTRLSEMGIEFIDSSADNEDRFSRVTADDVVMIPAFGAPVAEYQALQQKGCLVVDTTCGSVIAVWKRVEKYAKEGFTAIIHGKHVHEETQATSSQTGKYESGTYLIVYDKQEADYVCRYIVEGGDRAEFLNRFADACPPGFDPDRDLARIGLANQTTMLSSESLEIAEMFRASIEQKYGAEEVADRFRHFDTICSATQERQDAVKQLLEEPLDAMVVMGGFNSSNTISLAALCAERVPTYHVESPEGIDPDECTVHYRLPGLKHAESDARDWLPRGKVTLGITAGASTPNSKIGEAVVRILATRGLELPALDEDG